MTSRLTLVSQKLSMRNEVRGLHGRIEDLKRERDTFERQVRDLSLENERLRRQLAEAASR